MNSNAMDVDGVAGPSVPMQPVPQPMQADQQQKEAPVVTVEPSGTSSPIPNALATVQNTTTVKADAEGSARIARTGYVYDPLMMLHCQDGYVPTEDIHDTGEGHPEEPMRIKRIFTRLKDNGLIRRMRALPSRECTLEQVRLVHGDDHWLKVQGTESESGKVVLSTRG